MSLVARQWLSSFECSTLFLFNNVWKPFLFDRIIIRAKEDPHMYSCRECPFTVCSVLWWWECYEIISSITSDVYCMGGFPAHLFLKTTSFGSDVDLFIFCSEKNRRKILSELRKVLAKKKRLMYDPTDMYYHDYEYEKVNMAGENFRIGWENLSFFSYLISGPCYGSPYLNLLFLSESMLLSLPKLVRKNSSYMPHVLNTMENFRFDMTRVALKDMRLVEKDTVDGKHYLLSCKILALSTGEFPRPPLGPLRSSMYPYFFNKDLRLYTRFNNRIVGGIIRLQPSRLDLLAWKVCKVMYQKSSFNLKVLYKLH